MKARPSLAKRQKERARSDKKKFKAERREQKKDERSTKSDQDEGEDPDIAGIVPGPQKLDPELFGAESLTED